MSGDLVQCGVLQHVHGARRIVDGIHDAVLEQVNHLGVGAADPNCSLVREIPGDDGRSRGGARCRERHVGLIEGPNFDIVENAGIGNDGNQEQRAKQLQDSRVLI